MIIYAEKSNRTFTSTVEGWPGVPGIGDRIRCPGFDLAVKSVIWQWPIGDSEIYCQLVPMAGHWTSDLAQLTAAANFTEIE